MSSQVIHNDVGISKNLLRSTAHRLNATWNSAALKKILAKSQPTQTLTSLRDSAQKYPSFLCLIPPDRLHTSFRRWFHKNFVLWWTSNDIRNNLFVGLQIFYNWIHDENVVLWTSNIEQICLFLRSNSFATFTQTPFFVCSKSTWLNLPSR